MPATLLSLVAVSPTGLINQITASLVGQPGVACIWSQTTRASRRWQSAASPDRRSGFIDLDSTLTTFLGPRTPSPRHAPQPPRTIAPRPARPVSPGRSPTPPPPPLTHLHLQVAGAKGGRKRQLGCVLESQPVKSKTSQSIQPAKAGQAANDGPARSGIRRGDLAVVPAIPKANPNSTTHYAPSGAVPGPHFADPKGQ